MRRQQTMASVFQPLRIHFENCCKLCRTDSFAQVSFATLRHKGSENQEMKR
jgi:hypothetical protein